LVHRENKYAPLQAESAFEGNKQAGKDGRREGIFAMKEIVFITGGCRSGKSRFALDYADRHFKEKVFVATAEALDGEMTRRIQKHQEERGPDWTTIEEPVALPEKLASLGEEHHVALVDCLTLWISNLLVAGEKEPEILSRADALAAAIQGMRQSVIVVSNEVGSGIVPDNPMARTFRDLSGTINQKMAACADLVIFMVAGLPQVIKGKRR